MTNPFVFASPVERPPQFVDRESELRALVGLMRSGQGAVLISPRRYGKTSLLRRAVIDASRDRTIRAGMCSLAEVLAAQGAKGVAERIASTVLFGPMGGLEGKLKGFQRLAAGLRPRLVLTTGDDGRPKLALEGAPAEGDWSQAVADTVVVLAGLRKENLKPVLVIDEFQRAEELVPGFGWVFKDLTDRVEGLSLVLAGSKRHAMQQLADGPLQRVGAPMYLQKIERGIMVRHLLGLSGAAGKRMAEPVAERIYDLMDGVPRDVHELAFWAFEVAGNQMAVSLEHVEAGLETALGIRSDGYAARLNALAPVQGGVVVRLAHGAQPEPYAQAFMGAVGAKSTTSMRKALAALVEAELVERSPEGPWRLSDPMLRHWLVRRAQA